jgi:hypothetical protein
MGWHRNGPRGVRRARAPSRARYRSAPARARCREGASISRPHTRDRPVLQDHGRQNSQWQGPGLAGRVSIAPANVAGSIVTHEVAGRGMAARIESTGRGCPRPWGAHSRGDRVRQPERFAGRKAHAPHSNDRVPASPGSPPVIGIERAFSRSRPGGAGPPSQRPTQLTPLVEAQPRHRRPCMAHHDPRCAAARPGKGATAARRAARPRHASRGHEAGRRAKPLAGQRAALVAVVRRG